MQLGFKRSVEASINGQTLVVAFRKANPPMIWQFDLERNHSFTLTLQGEEGDWELGITSPKGEFYAITRFLNKETADEAFERVQKILTRHKSSWGKWIGRSLLALFVLIVVGIVGFLGMTGYSFYSLQKSVTDVSAMRGNTFTTPPTTEQYDGSPVPADQVLQAPETEVAPAPSVVVTTPAQQKQPVVNDGSPVPADQLLEVPKD